MNIEKEKKEANIVELDEKLIVIAIPSNAVELELTAKVWHNNQIITVKNERSFEEIRELIKEAEEGYIPPDAVFKLNRDILEAMK